MTHLLSAVKGDSGTRFTFVLICQLWVYNVSLTGVGFWKLPPGAAVFPENQPSTPRSPTSADAPSRGGFCRLSKAVRREISLWVCRNRYSFLRSSSCPSSGLQVCHQSLPCKSFRGNSLASVLPPLQYACYVSRWTKHKCKRSLLSRAFLAAVAGLPPCAAKTLCFYSSRKKVAGILYRLPRDTPTIGIEQLLGAAGPCLVHRISPASRGESLPARRAQRKSGADAGLGNR
jgi:hypothetical protein